MGWGWIDTFFHGFKSSYPYWYFLSGFEWVIKLGSNFSKSKRGGRERERERERERGWIFPVEIVGLPHTN